MCDWLSKNSTNIKQKILEHGAILFRGFHLNGVADFEKCIQLAAGEPIPYIGDSAGIKTRKSILRYIYEPTDVLCDEHIPMHSECSYAYTWPANIFFCCLEPAKQGGETPVADTRKILDCIPSDIQQKFLERKVLYVNNLNQGQWQRKFATEDHAQVERICLDAAWEIEWLSGDRLRMKTIREAIVTHPKTKERVWFNHCYPANIYSLRTQTREALLNTFDLEDLPRNTYYGDGEEIETETLEILRQAYTVEKIIFPWQRHDILMLDNMLFTHGRETFTPPRQIAVGMAIPIDRSSI